MTATHGTRWISRDLSHLYTQAREEGPLFFDVVIVGSGYGGAMAAAELSGRQDFEGNNVRILVLERGKEYVPGMFPSSGAEMPTHMRVHRSQSGETTGWLDGLFDVRVGPDVCALVGNGLGGGSLINAGVMEIPDWSSVPRMPRALTEELNRSALNLVKERLGARSGQQENTIALHEAVPEGTAKTQALRALDPSNFHLAEITVEMGAGANGTPWQRCELCGDCMTGCNVGAKKSLDTTLLHDAWSRGAEIYTGASVTKLGRSTSSPGPWELSVVFTGESLRRRHTPLKVRAGKVILAAGTLGSPEILMGSQQFSLKFSPRLGQQFSCNGDNILAVRETGQATDSVAPEHVPLDQRKVGPTITGVINVAKEETGPAFMIQEFAVPASLKLVFEETVTTSRLLHELSAPDRESHTGNARGEDPLGVRPAKMDQVLVLGVIGHDESSGQLCLPPLVRMDDSRAVEGRIRIDWPEARKSRLVDDAYSRVEKLISREGESPLLPNPLWRMLPEQLDFVFRSERGPLLTVHPLGGCPMGADRDQGVVDEYGRVYDFGSGKESTAKHDGLRVLDGSILPSSLGVNPALTIAAVAQRAARQMAGECGWTKHGTAKPMQPRPRARSLQQCTPPQPAPTLIELVEKLCGPVRIRDGRYMAELTLQYVPQALQGFSTQMERELKVAGGLSTLRIYTETAWHDQGVRFLDEFARRQHALLEAPVSGGLSLLQREPSRSWWRAVRGGVAYLVNRGLRDLWSMIKGWWQRRAAGEPVAALSLREAREKLKRLCALASRAGEVRRFDYKLEIGAATTGQDTPLARLIGRNRAIIGEKRFTYSCRGNPWRQLMELRVTDFLGLPCSAPPVLELDGRFMARQAVPLARIVSQANQVHALAESASFVLYIVRLFLSIHVWSFRAPDPMPLRTRELLPGTMKDLEPQVIEIELEPPRQGIPVLVRLTRYKGKNADDPADTRPPLVMIHGYSASGSSFTHAALPEPMAYYFWDKGRDIWILDLRTSAGMPSAILPWNFEDAALADIPVAIERILSITKREQVDVFAHCIGAVMLSMALLTDGTARQWQQINEVDPPDGVRARRYPTQVAALSGSIRRIVLSQKGPALVYSDGNVLRGYLMRLLRGLVLPQNYQFRAAAHQSLAEQGFDRLLSSLPYPDQELARENPWWPFAKTPWVGYRHRLDALYARAFSLKNVDNRTLAALEDLFGPLNLDTVSQAVHFARYNKITNGAGRNCFVTVTRMRECWPEGGTLSLHGGENGLADIRTLAEMKSLMDAAGLGGSFKTRCVVGFGHQDCLIGRDVGKQVFEPVEEFLS